MGRQDQTRRWDAQIFRLRRFASVATLTAVAFGTISCTQSALQLDGSSPRPSASITPTASETKKNEAGRVYAGQLRGTNTAAVDETKLTPAAPAKPKQIPKNAANASVGNGCLDIAGIREPDIRRNRTALTRIKACITYAAFTEARLPWQIYTIKLPNKKRGPLWAVPHDNENVAFDTAVYALGRYGGTIVAAETGERRALRGQDANRNFSKSNRIAARCPQQRAAAPKYTNAFISQHTRGQPIIALHSNANGYAGNGGSGTISINRRSRIMRAFKARRAKGRFADEDNIILVAGKRPVEQDRRLKGIVDTFNGKGIHVIAELVTPAKNDCSLSNYVVLNNIAKYYNVEVQTGQGSVQRQLLDRLMASGPR
ncbi:MAG: hypothetical protein AAGM04_07620 [Pseudomonadota bacterium]